MKSLRMVICVLFGTGHIRSCRCKACGKSLGPVGHDRFNISPFGEPREGKSTSRIRFDRGNELLVVKKLEAAR